MARYCVIEPQIPKFSARFARQWVFLTLIKVHFLTSIHLETRFGIAKIQNHFFWPNINFIRWKIILNLFGTWKTRFSRLEVSVSPTSLKKMVCKINIWSPKCDFRKFCFQELDIGASLSSPKLPKLFLTKQVCSQPTSESSTNYQNCFIPTEFLKFPAKL